MASALSSEKSRFLVYSDLNPLVKVTSTDGIKTLQTTVGWYDVKQYIAGEDGDAKAVFNGVDGKDEKLLGVVPAHWRNKGDIAELSSDERRGFFINVRVDRLCCLLLADTRPFPQQAALVFLGVDERSAPASAKSLPLSKPTDSSTLETHSPYGIPYWAFDISALPELKAKLLKANSGTDFVDLRSAMQSIPAEDASIGGEGRALLDWNKRNVVSSRRPAIVLDLAC